MNCTLPMLMLLALASTALAAPLSQITVAVDKTCGIVVGKTRINLGSKVDVFIAKLGKPTTVAVGDIPGTKTLRYPYQGLEVDYSATTRKILILTVDMAVYPRLSLSSGARLDAPRHALTKDLGSIMDSMSSSHFTFYENAACTLILPGPARVFTTASMYLPDLGF